MQPHLLKQQWNKQGYLVIPQLFSSVLVEELRTICNRIFQQWVNHSSEPEKFANLTNLAFLTEPDYFIDDPEKLIVLLNAIAHPKILNILAQIVEPDLIFHNTQYFFNPASYTRNGDWHRDQQFTADDEETEQLRMKTTVGIHVHIAFLPDNNLEYIPGSHQRWDTPQEREIRKGLNGKQPNSSEILNSHRINLNPGDAVFFDAWGIHRGNYIAEIPRQTFDIIYGTFCDWCIPSPTCFLQPNLLDKLTPQAQAFFQKFINTYHHHWIKANVSF